MSEGGAPAPVLVINAGGSSVKLSAFIGDTPVFTASLVRLGLSTAALRIQVAGRRLELAITEGDLEMTVHRGLTECAGPLADAVDSELSVIASRVKFGGPDARTRPFDSGLRSDIQRHNPLSSWHNLLCLWSEQFFSERYPDAVSLAVFDDAFFRRAYGELAAPTDLPVRPELVRRYGLYRGGHHGLACQAVLAALPAAVAAGKLIICHIGSGVSVSAVDDHVPVHNSMPYAACDGPMGNVRSGTVPPGVILQLMLGGMPWNDVVRTLTLDAGLYALADMPADGPVTVQDMLSARPDVLDRYCESIAVEVFRAAVRLGQVDAVVFSGGLASTVDGLPAKVLAKVGLSSQLAGISPTVASEIDEQSVLLAEARRHHRDASRAELLLSDGRAACPGRVRGRLVDGRDATEPALPSEVMVLQRLSPVAVLRHRRAAALLAADGEPVGHGAAMARELNVPSMVSVSLADLAPFGREVLVDCSREGVWLAGGT